MTKCNDSQAQAGISDLGIDETAQTDLVSRRTVPGQSLGIAVGAMLFGGATSAEAQAPAGRAGQAPGPTIRRVVTGHNAAGKSCIISDEMVTGALWTTSGVEPLGAKAAGETAGILANSGLVGDPPAGGTRWMIAAFQPSKDPKPSLENRQGFHRTSTIDYAYVLSGDVTLLLDVQEVTLKPGDVVVQRNTYHAWRVDGSVPARLLMMMLKVA